MSKYWLVYNANNNCKEGQCYDSRLIKCNTEEEAISLAIRAAKIVRAKTKKLIYSSQSDESSEEDNEDDEDEELEAMEMDPLSKEMVDKMEAKLKKSIKDAKKKSKNKTK